jgi:hypothetical protein
MKLTKTQKSLLAKLPPRMRLGHLVTMYDRLDSQRAAKKGRYFNHYALGLYLEACNRAEALVDEGQSWADAIGVSFQGGLGAFLKRNWVSV